MRFLSKQRLFNIGNGSASTDPHSRRKFLIYIIENGGFPTIFTRPGAVRVR
jgi:hypothetical protein